MAKFLISRRGLMGLTAGLVTVAGIGDAFAETTLEKARRQGYLRVGFANEAPYGYATPDGKLTGPADPEIGNPQSYHPEGLLAVHLPLEEMLPCVGQAAIGIEIRKDDQRASVLGGANRRQAVREGVDRRPCSGAKADHARARSSGSRSCRDSTRATPRTVCPCPRSGSPPSRGTGARSPTRPILRTAPPAPSQRATPVPGRRRPAQAPRAPKPWVIS